MGMESKGEYYRPSGHRKVRLGESWMDFSGGGECEEKKVDGESAEMEGR